MKKILLIATLLIHFALHGQDLVNTQTFGSPLHLNPAFAGNLAKTNFYLNVRQQWPSIQGSYISSSFSANHRFDNINSGIGLIISQDEEGSASFTTTNVSGIYSYIIHVNKEWTFSPALQLSYINSRFDRESFVFGDQINDDFSVSPIVNDNISFANTHNIDVSTGFLMYNKDVWFGFSTHHITEPSNFANGSSTLNRKYSFHTGYQYILKNSSLPEDITFSPSLNINYQHPFSRLGVSLSTTYHFFTLGTGIANISTQGSEKNILNSFFLVGYADEHFKIGYSYDFTILEGVGLGGAHEISLGIWLDYDTNSNKRSFKNKKIRRVSCPKF